MLSIARGVAEVKGGFGRRDNNIFTPPSTDTLCLKIFREREREKERDECQDISWGPFIVPPFSTCRPCMLDTWAPRLYSIHHDHVANDCVLFISFVIFTFPPPSLNEDTT